MSFSEQLDASDANERAVSPQPPRKDLHIVPRSRLECWLLVAAFALAILAAKLWLIDLAGSDVPMWDQWDAEGEATLHPWITGTLRPEQLLQPHNEHRLVLTRLYALGLFVANQQWDASLEAVLNAMVHTACGVVLLLLGARVLSGRWLIMLGGLLVLLFALPFSPDNTLVGFQVQFYLLLLLALGHIGLALGTERFGWGWVVGQMCGLLSLGTMASGFFSSVAVVGVLGLHLIHARRWTRLQLATMLLAAAFALIGALTMSTVDGHEPLKAHGLGQFFYALLHLLAWPGTTLFPWSLVLFLPAVVFCVRTVRRGPASPSSSVLLGLLTWVLFQCAALAYGRGGYGTASVLTNRYLDLLVPGIALGFIFIAILNTGWRRRFLALAWASLAIGGLVQQTAQLWRTNIVPNIPRDLQREEHLRAFLHTGDSLHLLNKPFGEVPYPDGSVLVQRLRPSIQEVMPASVRRAVPLLANQMATSLPPEVPHPEWTRAFSTWISDSRSSSEIVWRSSRQPADSLPILRFRIAGDLGKPGRDLELIVKSADREVAVVPEPTAGPRWKTVHVFRPAGEWWIEARDADPEAWFAFTEPVEVGRWSWAAHKLLKHHKIVFVVGFLLLTLGSWLRLHPNNRVAQPSLFSGT